MKSPGALWISLYGIPAAGAAGPIGLTHAFGRTSRIWIGRPRAGYNPARGCDRWLTRSGSSGWGPWGGPWRSTCASTACRSSCTTAATPPNGRCSRPAPAWRPRRRRWPPPARSSSPCSPTPPTSRRCSTARRASGRRCSPGAVDRRLEHHRAGRGHPLRRPRRPPAAAPTSTPRSAAARSAPSRAPSPSWSAATRAAARARAAAAGADGPRGPDRPRRPVGRRADLQGLQPAGHRRHDAGRGRGAGPGAQGRGRRRQGAPGAARRLRRQPRPRGARRADAHRQLQARVQGPPLQEGPARGARRRWPRTACPALATALVQQLVHAQVAAGGGEDDYSGVATVVFGLAGLD